MTAATIRTADLQLVLAAMKLRRHTAGRTCMLAALTPSPVLDCDCSNGRPVSDTWRQQSLRLGYSGPRIGPVHRGWISRVFERVACRGRREVVKTWGTGIRTLRAEPRYALWAGQAEGQA